MRCHLESVAPRTALAEKTPVGPVPVTVTEYLQIGFIFGFGKASLRLLFAVWVFAQGV